MKLLSKMLALLGVCTLLSACGLKGNLYLNTPEPVSDISIESVENYGK